MNKPILTDEIIETVRDVIAKKKKTNDEEAMTLVEWKEAFGFGEDKVRGIFRELKREGKLEVLDLYRENIIGIVVKVPGYKILIMEDAEISTD